MRRRNWFASGREEEGDVGFVDPLRVLWVGRMLGLKRVDTIVRAVAKLHGRAALTLVGDGPERSRLMKLAARMGVPVDFRSAVLADEVRELMRPHEVFVFASNALEGWGAVVSEAMTEGVCVVGTYEAGASAMLLPEENLFHTGDWKALAKILDGLARMKGCCGGHAGRVTLPVTPLPREYTPEGAAERLLGAVEGDGVCR